MANDDSRCRSHDEDVADVLLRHNVAYADRVVVESLGAAPLRRLTILTCMDSRIDVFAALGLQLGEAHVLRNAGGIATDDVIRSIAVSQHRLGTREVMVVQHSDCGLHGQSEDALRAELERSAGILPPFAVGAFTDLDENVRGSVRRLRESRFLPYRDRIRGFVYDVGTHRVREVDVGGPDA